MRGNFLWRWHFPLNHVKFTTFSIKLLERRLRENTNEKMIEYYGREIGGGKLIQWHVQEYLLNFQTELFQTTFDIVREFPNFFTENVECCSEQIRDNFIQHMLYSSG